jgi:hypothetical protein
MLTLPLVIVTWNDACGSTTKVYDEHRDHKATVMTTVGWLLKADQEGVSIACESYIEEGIAQYRGHTFIPLGMLVQVQKATTKGGRVIRKRGH